jgi:hypothetical protein
MMAITTSNSMSVKARCPRGNFMVSARTLTDTVTFVTTRHLGSQQMGGDTGG